MKIKCIVLVFFILSSCNYSGYEESLGGANSNDVKLKTLKDSQPKVNGENKNYDAEFNEACVKKHSEEIIKFAKGSLFKAQIAFKGFKWFKNEAGNPRCKPLTWIQTGDNVCAFECVFSDMETEEVKMTFYMESFHHKKEGDEPGFILNSIKHHNFL